MLRIRMRKLNVKAATREAYDAFGSNYGEPVVIDVGEGKARTRHYMIWSPAGLRRATQLEAYLFRGCMPSTHAHAHVVSHASAI